MNWTDIEDIAIELDEAHPGIDPLAVRFTQLRELVQGLDGFEPDPDTRVNEQILEAIQGAWIEERQDAAADSGGGEDGPGHTPHNPFR